MPLFLQACAIWLCFAFLTFFIAVARTQQPTTALRLALPFLPLAQGWCTTASLSRLMMPGSDALLTGSQPRARCGRVTRCPVQKSEVVEMLLPWWPIVQEARAVTAGAALSVSLMAVPVSASLSLLSTTSVAQRCHVAC
jgi:hypothetical protein